MSQEREKTQLCLQTCFCSPTDITVAHSPVDGAPLLLTMNCTPGSAPYRSVLYSPHISELSKLKIYEGEWEMTNSLTNMWDQGVERIRIKENH